jgi:hypothetical protein
VSADEPVNVSLVDTVVCTTLIGLAFASGTSRGPQAAERDMLLMVYLAVVAALAGGIAFAAARHLFSENGRAFVAAVYVPTILFVSSCAMMRWFGYDFTGNLLYFGSVWLVTAAVVARRARLPLLPALSVIGTVFFVLPLALLPLAIVSAIATP